MQIQNYTRSQSYKAVYSGRAAKKDSGEDLDLMLEVAKDLEKSKTVAGFQKNVEEAKRLKREKATAKRRAEATKVNKKLVTKSSRLKDMTKGEKARRLKQLKGELQNSPIDYSKHMPWLKA